MSHLRIRKRKDAVAERRNLSAKFKQDAGSKLNLKSNEALPTPRDTRQIYFGSKDSDKKGRSPTGPTLLTRYLYIQMQNTWKRWS
jgi:hypothetical protein